MRISDWSSDVCSSDLVAMLPAAFWAGGADKIPGYSTATTSMREVLGQAMRNRQFLVMSGAYFVCGLNLMFLTTHLPAYLAICGQGSEERRVGKEWASPC